MIDWSVKPADSIRIKNLGKGWRAHRVTFGAYEYEHISTGATLRRSTSMFDEDGISQWYLYHKNKPAEPVSNAAEANSLVSRSEA